MKSKAGRLTLTLAALACAGLLTRPLTKEAGVLVAQSEPALNLHDLEGALGQGISLALLGGFRGLVADFLWLEANGTWEGRDLPATQTLIAAATAVDPRPLFFWINGARMIAYDMPAWRIEAAGGSKSVPAAVQRRIDEEQASAALRLLERARRYHPDDPLLLIEMGNIVERRMADTARAAEWYRQAAGQSGAPYYAGRIYGEMLIRLGRLREAHGWLCQLHAGLPRDDPAALPEMVLLRIRQLEEHLQLPETDRYRPGGPGPAEERPPRQSDERS